MPFHPEAYKTGRVEYLEQELNELMNEKQKNEKHAKIEFDKRLRESKEKAMRDNEKKAQESGNKLSQTIKDGELVNIQNMNTSEIALLHNKANKNTEVAAADIRKELFEGDNIVIDHKNSDHGLSLLEENQKSKLEDITEEVEATEATEVKINDFEEVD